MKTIIKEHKVCGSQLEYLEEMDDFWVKCKLPTLTLEGVEKLNISVALGEIKKWRFFTFNRTRPGQNALADELYLSFEEKAFLILFKPF